MNMKKRGGEGFDRVRREVIKLGAAASAAGILGIACSSREQQRAVPGAEKPAAPTGPAPQPAKQESSPAAPEPGARRPGAVVRVASPGMRAQLSPDPKRARDMVQLAVSRLAGKEGGPEAWAQFVKPADRVAVKVNALGGTVAATQRVVADAVVEGVRSAGVPEKNVMIFDQFDDSMARGGYPVVDEPGAVRVLGEKGLGYEAPRQVGRFTVRLSKALTWATAIINVPVLKEHPMCGTSGAIKNMVFGCVESPAFLHDDINEALVEIYAGSEMRDKVRLHVIDGSHVQYDGGPMYAAGSRAQHDCIYAAADPVAIDAVEWEVVELYRAENGLSTLTEAGRPPLFLELAEKRGLGVAGRSRVTLDEIELPA